MNSERLEKPFFIVMLVFAIVLAAFVFLPELNVIVLGAALAIFFHPIYLRIQRGMPRHDGLAAFLTILLAAIVIVVPLTMFGYALFSEAQGLYAHLAAGGISSLESLVTAKLGSLMEIFHQSSGTFAFANFNVSQYATQAMGTIVANAGNFLSSMGMVAWTFFLAFFAFFYLLKDGGKLRKLVVRGVPLTDERANEIVQKMVDTTTSVVRGSLLMAIVWGVVVGIEFLIFGVPNPVLWGALSVPIAFIPVIGVSLIVIPGILYVALVAGIVKAIIFAIIAFIVSMLMENILHPLFIGRGTHIHPLLLLLSVLGGLSFFGPIGLFLGPLVLSFSLTLFEIYPTLITNTAKK
jgi:predicted PurR-regulated permease PerM